MIVAGSGLRVVVATRAVDFRKGCFPIGTL